MMIELPGDAGNEAVNESAYELKSKVCAQHNNVPSKDECQQAYDDLKVSNKLEATRPMQLGDWPDLPTGCSVQYDNAAYDQAPHYNTNPDPEGSRLSSGEFRTICVRGTEDGGHLSLGQLLPPYVESIDNNTNATNPLNPLNKDEGKEGEIRAWVGQLLGKIRSTGVELEEVNGTAVYPPEMTGKEPLWKPLLQAQLKADRAKEHWARVSPATARDWQSVAADLYGSTADFNRTIDKVWEQTEEELRREGRQGSPGKEFDFRYPEGWVCDDKDFANGPNASGCCPSAPPPDGWDACKPYIFNKYCPVTIEAKTQDYCLRPTRTGYDLGALPTQCFGNKGLKQMAGCDPLGNYSLLWSCDHLREAELCLGDVATVVCPQLVDLVEQEKSVVSHMLDLRGCSLKGHSIVSLNPNMRARRAIRLTEAEAARQRAISSNADAVYTLAEARRLDTEMRVNASIEALEIVRAEMRELMPACNESLQWPKEDGSPLVPPETACGAGCSVEAGPSKCALSTSDPSLQMSCGLGLYGTADARACAHLVEGAIYKLCHKMSGLCATAESLTSIALSDTAFPMFSAQGFTPVAMETTWTLSAAALGLYTLQPKVVDKTSESICLADMGNESITLCPCRESAARWSLDQVFDPQGGIARGSYILKSANEGRCWGVKIANRCETVVTDNDGRYKLALRNARLGVVEMGSALIVELQTDQQAEIGLLASLKPPSTEGGDTKCPLGYILFEAGYFCCQGNCPAGRSRQTSSSFAR